LVAHTLPDGARPAGPLDPAVPSPPAGGH